MTLPKRQSDSGTGLLRRRITRMPLPADVQRAATFRQDFVDTAGRHGCEDLVRSLDEDDGLRALLAGALDGSPWLRIALGADPAMAERVLLSDPDRHLDVLCQGLRDACAAADDQDVTAALRRFKSEAAALVALADLAGAWEIDAVIRAMSRIADTAIGSAADHLLRRAARKGEIVLREPDNPGPGSGWIVLAMGKHGACELNFSSDVDLIVFYDAERARLRDSEEAGKFYIRLTRDLARLLQEHTGDGYVFRIDLRLRPDPGATAIAISLDAALEYYESLGQNWERAALLKARPCAGDIAAGEGFLDDIAPFVWRKYMDFAALADVHAMKRQIHARKGHGTIAVLGHNIKLGRGGIREIEFFVQTQQLVVGGRHPELRVRETLLALQRLSDGHWIDETARAELADAYRFLRRIEHRLQMVADEQIHALPGDREGLTTFARFAGYADGEALAEELVAHMRTVQRHYADLFEGAPQLSSETGSLVFTGDDDDPETLETLSQMGFTRPRDVIAGVRGWHFGRISATRSARAREVLTEITPALLEELADTANPDAAFIAFDRFLASLPAGVQVFSLLRSNPHILALLAEILGTAPRLADLLGRRPNIFAAVLEPDFFDALPDRETLERLLDETLGDADGYEDVLDRVRIFGQEQSFLIGVRILSGTVSAGDAGAAFTRLAELLVARMHALAGEELAQAHGCVPGGASAVVAMGKLGGGEMTSASDVDLLLLYDHDKDETTSDGARSLDASQYFIRLTKRLVAALSAPTAEGQLYAVDMRLRPSGHAGPLATHIDGFAEYQASGAWVWEHMALTRARVISGPEPLRRRVEQVIRQSLDHSHEPQRLIADILDMRRRLYREKGSDDPWQIKAVRGGLVDVEFIAQYLQLAHGKQHPEIYHQNTGSALTACRHAGVLSPGDADVLESAFRLYETVTQILGLCLTGPFNPETCPRGLARLLAKATDVPDIPRLQAHLVDTQDQMRDTFERVIGDPDAAGLEDP